MPPKLLFGGVDRCANARNPRSIPRWRIPEAQQKGPRPCVAQVRFVIEQDCTTLEHRLISRYRPDCLLRVAFTLASGLCQRHVEWHQNLYHQPTRHFPPVRAPASSGFEVQPNRPLRVQAVARLPEGLRSHFDIVKMKSGLEPANLGILSVQHCA